MPLQNLHVTNDRIKKALLEAHRRKKVREKDSKTKEELASEWLEVEQAAHTHTDKAAGSRRVFGQWCRQTPEGEWRSLEDFEGDAALGIKEWHAAAGRGMEDDLPRSK